MSVVKKPPQHFVLNPLRSRAYLQAVLEDAGLSSTEAESIAIHAHDCAGADGEAGWQKAQLERTRANYFDQAQRLLDKKFAIERVLDQFYGDVTSADAVDIAQPTSAAAAP